MKVFEQLEACCQIANPVVTIGTFDGLHLGHQQILQRLRDIARKLNGETLVITFWPHPRHVVDDSRSKLKLLNSMREKYELFERFGLDNLLVLPFTKEFSKQDPEDFIKELLVKKVGAQTVVIGYDHRFGKNRSGSFEYLYEHAKRFNFSVEEVGAFQIDDEAISSTRIRRLLEDGDVMKAGKFLGYDYFVYGTVSKGLGLGKNLGYPTANISVQDELKLLPGSGIYVCSVEVLGKQHYGMLNIGHNPTIKNKGWSMEVNIFDFEGDIYGKEIKISFLKRLRNEVKFDGLEALKAQMALDREASLAFIDDLNK